MAFRTYPSATWQPAAGHSAAYPIRKPFDAGVIVTVNTDDVLVFGRSVSEESLSLFQAKLICDAELEGNPFGRTDRSRAIGRGAVFTHGAIPARCHSQGQRRSQVERPRPINRRLLLLCGSHCAVRSSSMVPLAHG